MVNEFKPIDVDIDVFRVLEGQRQRFEESHNDILRRVLLGEMAGAGAGDAAVLVRRGDQRAGTADPDPSPSASQGWASERRDADTPPEKRMPSRQWGRDAAAAVNEKHRRGRRTGTYRVVVLGDPIEATSLKEAYKMIVVSLAKRDGAFLTRLSLQNFRSRKIVAKEPSDLYRKSPGLAKDHAERLLDGWWIDTNLSRSQIRARLECAAAVAGLAFGKDIQADFLLD